MNARLLLILLAFGIALAWPHGAPLGQEEEHPFLPENPLEGRALFTSKRCILCHSIQGIGGRIGPDLGDIRQNNSFADIASSIWNHMPRMKEAFERERLARPRFSPEEMQQLIAFLYFLNYFDRSADAEMGERIFHEKNCIRCHSVGGKGGDIGPELDSFQTRSSLPVITSELWNKGPEMAKEMRKRKIPRPQFRERDVIDILAFIRVKGLSQEKKRAYVSVGNPLNGRGVFEEKNCTRCHAVRGEGGEVGPDLARQNLKGSLSFIVSNMWNHGSNMWDKMKRKGIAFPTFEPEEMSDLISYLYFIQYEETPGSAEAGERVFRGKKCAECHFPQSPGEKRIGPDLAEMELDSPFKVIAEMWNHAPAIENKMKERKIRWPNLERGEMRHLIAYLQSLGEKEE